MRKEIPVVAVLVLIIAGIATYSYVHQKPKPDPCIAGPTEQCPSPTVRDSWRDFIARRNAYTEKNKDEIRLLQGWGGELDRQTPPGYRINEETLKYEKQVTPLPPPTPEAPKKP